MKGTYCLIIELKKSIKTKIGALGKIEFMPGYYVYVGSAMNSIESRVKRHLADDKKLHWHIDYLLKNKDADIVVITAGANQKPGQTRLELLKINAKIIKEITENVVKSGFDGIFVIATNPVDLMTYVVEKVSKFPTSKVIGSGTVLDTCRLRYIIGDKLQISPKNVHAYIMGEHGDSSFAVWSHSYVGCKPMIDVIKERNLDQTFLDSVYKEVQQEAYEIINKKKATYYGIGLSLTKIVKTILDNENEIITVSTYIDGNYGHSGLFIGVPAVITNKGVREILNINLSEEEQNKFDNSFNILNNLKEEIDKLL